MNLKSTVVFELRNQIMLLLLRRLYDNNIYTVWPQRGMGVKQASKQKVYKMWFIDFYYLVCHKPSHLQHF